MPRADGTGRFVPVTEPSGRFGVQWGTIPSTQAVARPDSGNGATPVGVRRSTPGGRGGV